MPLVLRETSSRPPNSVREDLLALERGKMSLWWSGCRRPCIWVIFLVNNWGRKAVVIMQSLCGWHFELDVARGRQGDILRRCTPSFLVVYTWFGSKEYRSTGNRSKGVFSKNW